MSSARRAQGVSLPELLVVVAILALATMVSLPMIAERVYSAQLHSAASQFATTLRAARMVAVTRRVPVAVTVAPDGSYAYMDSGGKQRMVRPPAGIRIVAVPASVVFESNGAAQAAMTTTFEAAGSVGDGTRWEVSTPLSGIPRLVRLPPGTPSS